MALRLYVDKRRGKKSACHTTGDGNVSMLRDRIARLERKDLAITGEQLPEPVQMDSKEELGMFNDQLLDDYRTGLWVSEWQYSVKEQ